MTIFSVAHIGGSTLHKVNMHVKNLQSENGLKLATSKIGSKVLNAQNEYLFHHFWGMLA